MYFQGKRINALHICLLTDMNKYLKTFFSHIQNYRVYSEHDIVPLYRRNDPAQRDSLTLFKEVGKLCRDVACF